MHFWRNSTGASRDTVKRFTFDALSARQTSPTSSVNCLQSSALLLKSSLSAGLRNRIFSSSRRRQKSFGSNGRAVCVVADRGMISAETVAELEARRLLYILGVRERTDKLVCELVLDDPAPFVPLAVKKRGKEIEYQAKTVTLAGRRYIVCRNHQEAQKDAADRASIVAALERQLAKGDKALVSNTSFRRYLKTISDEHFAIDPDKIEEEKRFDGIFALRTNTDLNPLEAMLC